jgi:hypothetical protein
LTSALIITAIRAAFSVSASAHSPAASRCSRNRQAELRVLGEHIQPARLANRNGSSASHSTRILLREVRPPHE